MSSLVGIHLWWSWPLRAQWRFDDCEKCKHGHWCTFANEKTTESQNRLREYEKMTLEEKRKSSLACLRGNCKHIRTARCGDKSAIANVGKCDHEHAMCVTPKRHGNPNEWARIYKADSGKSFVEYVDVEQATKAERQAHIDAVRKRRGMRAGSPAASSSMTDDDMDEMLEPA